MLIFRNIWMESQQTKHFCILRSFRYSTLIVVGSASNTNFYMFWIHCILQLNQHYFKLKLKLKSVNSLKVYLSGILCICSYWEKMGLVYHTHFSWWTLIHLREEWYKEVVGIRSLIISYFRKKTIILLKTKENLHFIVVL